MRTLILSLVVAAALTLASTASATVPGTYALEADRVALAVDEASQNPLHHAVGLPVALSQDDGVWDEPQVGVARWRLQLRSESAHSLSARLDELRLPPGGELFLRALEGEDQQGPFTASAPEGLSLPLVRSDRVLLEAQMPAGLQSAFAIRIGEIFHGFRPFVAGNALLAKGALGSADGSCHNDVACSIANPWRDQVRATVLITISQSGLLLSTQTLCSGVLVNNTRQDERPMVLTANHCGLSSSTDFGRVITYFNVQRPSCGGGGNGPVNMNVLGKSLLSRNGTTDYALFELRSKPPTSFNAFYSGWDARDQASSSGAGIHHPGGDDKKISIFSSPAVKRTSNILGSGLINSWEIFWSSGVTEQGSSGSGLWNQDRRLVGLLSGGSDSCSNRNGGSYYGRLENAWTVNGNLKTLLDPTGSGALTLDGRNGSGTGSSGSSGNNSGGTTSASGERSVSDGGGSGSAFAWLVLLAAAACGRRLRRH